MYKTLTLTPQSDFDDIIRQAAASGLTAVDPSSVDPEVLRQTVADSVRSNTELTREALLEDLAASVENGTRTVDVVPLFAVAIR